MVSTPHRGEIWWMDDPEVGRRPGLILTRETAIEVLTWLLVAPITRTVRDIPTEVGLDEPEGMSERCAITLDNVRPIRKSLMTERIATLSSDKMNDVCEALARAVDC